MKVKFYFSIGLIFLIILKVNAQDSCSTELLSTTIFSTEKLTSKLSSADTAGRYMEIEYLKELLNTVENCNCLTFGDSILVEKKHLFSEFDMVKKGNHSASAMTVELNRLAGILWNRRASMLREQSSLERKVNQDSLLGYLNILERNIEASNSKIDSVITVLNRKEPKLKKTLPLYLLGGYYSSNSMAIGFSMNPFNKYRWVFVHGSLTNRELTKFGGIVGGGFTIKSKYTAAIVYSIVENPIINLKSPNGVGLLFSYRLNKFSIQTGYETNLGLGLALGFKIE